MVSPVDEQSQIQANLSSQVGVNSDFPQLRPGSPEKAEIITSPKKA